MNRVELSFKSLFFNSVYENLYPNRDYDTSRVIQKDDSIINRQNRPKTYDFYNFYDDFCLDSHFVELKKSHIVCTGLGTIKPLESIVYTSDIIESLNKNGLEIYLWEVILVDTLPKREMEIDPTLEDLSPLDYIFPEVTDLNLIYSYEFESIRKFVQNNLLNNVTVITCEYETSRYLQHLYPEVHIESMNTLITTYRNYLQKPVGISFSPQSIQNKFLCLNLRYEPYRHIIAAHTVQKSSIVTWNNNKRDWHKTVSNKLDINYLNNTSPINFDYWKVQNPKYFDSVNKGTHLINENFPLRLEKEKHLSRIECGSQYPLPYEEYSKTFCHIINETTFFKPFATFSEKVVNTMYCLRPFIMVSTPKSLEYLKKLGFKTFDQWWDESYDQEQDHEKRLIKILELIDYIDSFSVNDLQMIYKEMNNVLQHNFNQLKDVKKKNLRFI